MSADATRARRERLVVAGVVAAVAALSVLAVLFFLWDTGEEETARTVGEDSPPIDARAVLSPRITLFGDTVRAHVDVTVSQNVAPESVRVAAEFTPWEVVGKPQRTRRDAGDLTHLRTTFVLRCLTSPCVPSGQAAPLEFDPATVSYAATGSAAGSRNSFPLPWPVLLVYSRFASSNLDGFAESASPWRADVITLPAASYRLTPGILVALLLSGTALAAVAAVALAYVAWPRRAPAPPPEPEPPPPEPVLSPLEQALALLEESAREDGAADQRRALELVAEELELAEWGDPDLARSARALAWSENVPPVAETSGLAARIRTALAELERAEEEAEEQQHVV